MKVKYALTLITILSVPQICRAQNQSCLCFDFQAATGGCFPPIAALQTGMILTSSALTRARH